TLEARGPRQSAGAPGLESHDSVLRSDRARADDLDLAVDARPACAGECGGAVWKSRLEIHRRDQTSLADLSAGGDLPPNGRPHRRADRLAQGHVERGVA